MTYTSAEFSEQVLFGELAKMAKNEHIDVF